MEMKETGSAGKRGVIQCRRRYGCRATASSKWRVREVNRIIIEAKFTVNINSTAVQKVINVTDDQGALENVADQLTVLGEGRADRGTERVNKIPKWGVGGGSGVADAGAKVKGWDVEDSSLELVSGGDDSSVGGVSLERRDRWKDRRVFKKGSVGRET
jgi:hypothetical protein